MKLFKFKNHYDDNVTLVFKYDNQKYIINGCQIFLDKEKDIIFKEYKVDLKYQNDVNEALEKLNGNVNGNDLLYIVKTYSSFFKYIKHEDKTYEMALIAAKDWGGNLKYVNKNLQDYNMVLTAVKNWGGVLKYVREDLKTEELYKLALENNKNLSFIK